MSFNRDRVFRMSSTACFCSLLRFDEVCEDSVIIQSASVVIESLNNFECDIGRTFRRTCATILDEAGISESESAVIKFSTVVLFQIPSEHC